MSGKKKSPEKIIQSARKKGELKGAAGQAVPASAALQPEHLAPKTRKIIVDICKLVPDPNNPRFTTCEADRVASSTALDMAITGETKRKMCPSKGDPYRIADLSRSIEENGWQPVDAMFVRKLENHDDRYVVLEGNRRLMAILSLLSSPAVDKQLKERIQKIEVLEVLVSGENEEALKDQITYLLGVRHHGSLKRWSAFAQAANIYKRYKECAQIDDTAFIWKDACAGEVASSLSISTEVVRQRLKVFISMRQISRMPRVNTPPGEILAKHYSLVEEGIKRKNLKSFLPQDESTFVLSEIAENRFVDLCHFDKANRDGAPIKDPQEWRSLGNIVGDQDVAKREENIRRVIENKEIPSVVWAERSAQLRQITWETWLKHLQLRLSEITLNADFTGEAPRALVKELRELLDKLQQNEAGKA